MKLTSSVPAIPISKVYIIVLYDIIRMSDAVLLHYIIGYVCFFFLII